MADQNFCRNCGTKTVEGQRFCSNCGSPIDNSTVGNAEIYVGGNVGRDVIKAGRDVYGTGSQSVSTVITPFQVARDQLRSLDLPNADRDDAMMALDQLENQNDDNADESRIQRWLNVLESIAPSIAKILVEAILAPGAAASSAMKTVISALRSKK